MNSPVSLPLRALLLLGLLLLAQRTLAAPTVLVLGDSISAAYGMSLEQGWVALLERQLKDRDPDIRVVNASISGDTSAGGMRRLPPLLERYQPELLIIELGGNDGLRGYPTPQLRDNLEQMIRDGRESGARVLILPMEIPPNYGPRYTGAFRAAFAEAAENAGATLGPFLMEHVATETGLMQEDGIHPTAAAQPMLLENLLPTINTLLKNPGDP